MKKHTEWTMQPRNSVYLYEISYKMDREAEDFSLFV